MAPEGMIVFVHGRRGMGQQWKVTAPIDGALWLEQWTVFTRTLGELNLSTVPGK
jgi:hypothetical protein